MRATASPYPSRGGCRPRVRRRRAAGRAAAGRVRRRSLGDRRRRCDRAGRRSCAPPARPAERLSSPRSAQVRWTPVMSPSAKPRFAGRQPSSRWGAPGDDLAPPHGAASASSRGAPVMTATPTRSTGAVWRAGDPVGDRRFVTIGDLALEHGGVLPDVTVAYETWGTLLAQRATTRCSSSTPSPATPRRRRRRAGARRHRAGGRADRSGRPARHRPPVRRREQRARRLPGHDRAVVTRPDGRPWGGRFPFVTIRDQVAAEVALADALGIQRWTAVLGGSMGGMRVLEWAAGRPDRVERALVLASHALRHRRPGRPGASRSCSRSGPTRRSAAATTTASRLAGHGHGHRPPDRPHHLPARGRARPPVRPRPQRRRGPARRRGPLRRRELPRPPRGQAGPSVRPEQLRRAHRGDEQP